MAASATLNPEVKTDSKSAKKKKAAKVTQQPSESAPVVQAVSNNGAENGSGDGSYESPYIKELYKSIRNVNKKITNASKVDNVLAENPDKTLDDLVTARKINADQKAQILKKPQLQASLSQLEEQIAQYKKFDEEYKTKLASEKAEFEKSFKERADQELSATTARVQKEAQAKAEKDQKDALLLISQFLRLAAIRRADETADVELDENKALEGLLSRVYTGDALAVEAMTKLIEGSDETTTSLQAEPLKTTFADIKAATLAQPLAVAEEAPAYEEAAAAAAAAEVSEYPVQSDPTLTNIVLTEMADADASSTAQLANGHKEEAYDARGIPQNSGFGDGSANAAAEANWDNNNDLSTSQEWVEVPRDATETDNGVAATPAAPSNVQSWADDTPDVSTPAVNGTSTQAANPNDGFHEVQRNRGAPRGDGQNRGRGGRGGRGSFRGEGRGGRGRGGSRGGPRGGGAPRTNDS